MNGMISPEDKDKLGDFKFGFGSNLASEHGEGEEGMIREGDQRLENEELLEKRRSHPNGIVYKDALEMKNNISPEEWAEKMAKETQEKPIHCTVEHFEHGNSIGNGSLMALAFYGGG